MTFYLVTDLETTGLSAQKDVILEAAFVLVNERLQPQWIVGGLVHMNNDKRYIDALRRCLFGDDQYVNRMHSESGLWDDWNDQTKPHDTPEAFADRLVEKLIDSGMEPGTVPMLGNSIGSLDRPFVQEHMPKLNDFLSYRNMDISAVRMMVTDYWPKIQERWEGVLATIEAEGGNQHRALWDASLSIEQYKFYLSELGAE